MKDNRGSWSRENKRRIRKDIIDFFTRNKGSTQVECSKSIGVSAVTVNTHMKEIREEAKNNPELKKIFG